ncbi:MAG: transcription antitermination factor NusB [Nitrospirae bacterium]|nr:transcription antitermination factor NusB [Nitrospirota bacterium]
MKRRKAREYVLQFLFQSDFRDNDHRSNLKQFWTDKNDADQDIKKFSSEIIEGTLSRLDEIDSTIKGAAEHWILERMAAVDRNILRFAVYELLYRNDIPPAVTINEAIEIAKKYSTAEAASFINGILDKIAGSTEKKQRGSK